MLAEAIDFPGALSQGFDLPDARLMIASAMEDLVEAMLEEGKVLPVPDPETMATDADLVELIPSKSAGNSTVPPVRERSLQKNNSAPET